jgi:hypothetical protein
MFFNLATYLGCDLEFTIYFFGINIAMAALGVYILGEYGKVFRHILSFWPRSPKFFFILLRYRNETFSYLNQCHTKKLEILFKIILYVQ